MYVVFADLVSCHDPTVGARIGEASHPGPFTAFQDDSALQLARGMNGTDFVSKFLNSNPDAAPMLVSALFRATACFANHPHGVSVVSEPVYHCRDLKLSSTVDVLVSCLKGPLARLTVHRFDCRVAQAALREATPEPQQCLASELQGPVISICQHLHANFALHLCFELLEPHFDAVSVAVQVCGCSVLQRLIEHCSCEPPLIVENVGKLIAKQVDAIPCPKSRISDVPRRGLNGTDVVSKFFSSNPDAAPMLVSALVREVAYLAGHPHDTGVVIEPVCPCQDLKLSSLVDAISRSLKGSFVRLTAHRFGCRVAQAALREAAQESPQWLVSESQGQDLSICQRLLVSLVLQWRIDLLEPHFHAVPVEVHVGDCRVLQRLIAHCSCMPLLFQLVDPMPGIVENVKKLLAKTGRFDPLPKAADLGCSLC